jgi:hypothetical protein
VQTSIHVSALRIFLKKDVEPTIESRVSTTFIMPLDGGYDAVNLIVLRAFVDGSWKEI